jgi:hypothetical protein
LSIVDGAMRCAGTLDNCARPLAGSRGGAAPLQSMERPMPCYAPELTESVIDQYLHTDKPVGLIARDHAIDERDVTRIRHAAGVPPRGARVRSLPPAMAVLLETRALLRAPAANAGGAESVGRAKLVSAPAETSVPATEEPDDNRAGTAPMAPLPALPALDRIERLVEQELAAEEAGRAKLGLLPRAPSDAERCARTLAILTRTLHALARLRGGATDQGLRHDDDIPADIDEFRRDLARRIDAFVAAETHRQDAEDDSRAAALDDAR